MICCAVMRTLSLFGEPKRPEGDIARLPRYIYSIAQDGLYVNLFAASSITWTHGGQSVTLKTETAFPYDGKVAMSRPALCLGPVPGGHQLLFNLFPAIILACL